jgi:hypothetical protein
MLLVKKKSINPHQLCACKRRDQLKRERFEVYAMYRELMSCSKGGRSTQLLSIGTIHTRVKRLEISPLYGGAKITSAFRIKFRSMLEYVVGSYFCPSGCSYLIKLLYRRNSGSPTVPSSNNKMCPSPFWTLLQTNFRSAKPVCIQCMLTAPVAIEFYLNVCARVRPTS